MALNETSPFSSNKIIARKTMHGHSFSLRVVLTTNIPWPTSNAIFSKRFPFRSLVWCFFPYKLPSNECACTTSDVTTSFGPRSRMGQEWVPSGQLRSLISVVTKIVMENEIVHNDQRNLYYNIGSLSEKLFFRFINTLKEMLQSIFHTLEYRAVRLRWIGC